MPSPRSSRASETGSVERLDANIPGAFPNGNESQAAISTHQTLSQALYDRRAEYTRARDVRIKVGTWNIAGQSGTEKDIGEWFVGGKGIEEKLAGLGVDESNVDSGKPRESVRDQEARSSKLAPTVPHNDEKVLPGDEEIGIYALGIQEVVDISSATEALRPYTDPAPANRWKNLLETALPQGYKLVAEQQLIGLLLLVYASPSVHPHLKSISTTSVGTGLMGYMGNKGAVTARIVLGETTRLVFINSHLAAGADKTALERRNWDASQIVSRTKFDPVADAMGVPTQGRAEGLGEEDFAFWFGDLNYRLEGLPTDDVRRLLTVHTKDLDAPDDSTESGSITSTSTAVSKEASSKSSSEDEVPLPAELDPASLQTTILSLLSHDELHQQQRAGKAFHDGWEEGPIRFLPSYKYDVGKVGVFDSSEKRRCPSWCDRILYRTRARKLRHDAKAKEQEEAKKKDEEMKAKGLDHANDDEDVLYDYDPDTDGDNTAEYDDYDENADPEPEQVVTKEGFADEILLESYTTHMRVLSSDHKPLDAVFSLKYDAVVPELKTAIHQEIVRELDRQENEGRPSIAVVVDRSTGSAAPENNDKTDSAFDGVDFGDIKYAKSKRRHITIANTGQVPATFGFTDRVVDKDQPQGPFPPWLTVSFDKEPDKVDKTSPDNFHQQYTLEPGDVCNAELRLKIDVIEAVKKLNEETSTLDEVLVLRVQGGRDHFLPIHGRWLQSSLASSIDKLIKIPEGGIRKLQHQKPAGDDKVRWSVPREIFRLTEALEDLTERTLADWDMTGHEGNKAPWQHNAGWPFVKDKRYFAHDSHDEVMVELFDALDCDTPFEQAFDPEVAPMQRLETLAEVLLQFLRSLQDGVITEDLWRQLENGIQAREKSKQQLAPDDEKMWVMEILASKPSHNATFLILTTMLQRIASQIADASKPDPKTPRSSMDLPASPQVSVRRRTLSKVPEVAVRQLVVRNHATVFAEAMVKAGGSEKLRERDRAARKERMIRVVEIFLEDDTRR